MQALPNPFSPRQISSRSKSNPIPSTPFAFTPQTNQSSPHLTSNCTSQTQPGTRCRNTPSSNHCNQPRQSILFNRKVRRQKRGGGKGVLTTTRSASSSSRTSSPGTCTHSSHHRCRPSRQQSRTPRPWCC